MPPIQGVRPLCAPLPESAIAHPDEPPASLVAAESEPDSLIAEEPAAPGGIDPWGVGEEPEAEETSEETEEPVPTRGGGLLTIPLLCIGIAVIACVTLLPLADENHRLAWEREKLKADLAQLKEQVRVNEEFLSRLADDPTLAERLAQRQMKYIREGSSVLQLRGAGNKEEMSPFHLVAVPPPQPLPPYQPVGGAMANLVRTPRTQLYLVGGALLLMATGLVLGYTPKPSDVRSAR